MSNTSEKPQEILDIGVILSVDEEGNLISQSSIDRITFVWTQPVREVVEAYKEQLGNRLHSIYVRGSVSRGTAVEGVSDLDLIIVTYDSPDQINLDWKSDLLEEVQEKYPFCNGIDADEYELEKIITGQIPLTAFNIKILSACVYSREEGDDLTHSLPAMKPGEGGLTSEWFNKARLEKKIAELRTMPVTDPKIKVMSKWLMKHLLRVGFELVMERDQSYTRDLYKCYERFSKYFPEREAQCRKMLELSINHTDSRDELLDILEGIGMFIVTEAGAEDGSVSN